MDRYAHLKEFLDDLELTGEIEFAYGGKTYSLAYTGKSVSIVEHGKPETERLYKSPEEFIEEFEIDDKKFKEIVTEIDLLLH